MLQFPKDKGDARWPTKADRLFLGIDHTAIVVADTEASLAFYRDRLGLKVAGDKNWQALLAVAEAHFALGNKEKARDFGAKAVAVTEKENAGVKRYVENQVKKFEDKKD